MEEEEARVEADTAVVVEAVVRVVVDTVEAAVAAKVVEEAEVKVVAAKVRAMLEDGRVGRLGIHPVEVGRTPPASEPGGSTGRPRPETT